jgi:MFS family permease
METANLNAPAPQAAEVKRLCDLSPLQWKSGIAAWLGWTFDGLELHLYTLVAVPFVAELLRTDARDPAVGHYGSIIQAGFLVGWALGGGFFGRIGDRLGRSRALCLTILTYAIFAGLAVFATRWWHLVVFRFVSALGIGGEWAVGAALLSETWPKKWRPWIAAVLQTGVNVGILVACVAMAVMKDQPPRYFFLVGVAPALVVLWIRRAVPEPAEWRAAKERTHTDAPGILDLFREDVRGITLSTVAVCAISLSGHWAFMFWNQQQFRKLPEVLLMSADQQNLLVSKALYLIIASSILGNFAAAWVARRIGYRLTITAMCFGYFLAMMGAYCVPRDHAELLFWMPIIGFFQGVFALFTMYLPPLFPTLLRTTGAGFCYNIGRIAAAFGTVFFGLFSRVSDHRIALLCSGLLFLPATVVSFLLPKARD